MFEPLSKRPVLLVPTVPPARRARQLQVVSCSVPQRVDHGPFVEGPVAGWESKGAPLRCAVRGLVAEEVGVV